MKVTFAFSDEILQILNKLTRSGYKTGIDGEHGSNYVRVDMEKPYMVLRVVDVPYATNIPSLHVDKNNHPRALATSLHVAKLLGMGEPSDGNESPF